ncbi:MAG: peptidyl-prolyl cis-trans isomerase [Prosthecobacter sp.]
MLEFFRRHRGAFLITLTIIIIICFSVWGVPSRERDHQRRAQVTDLAMTIGGRDYTIGDVERAQRSLQFSQQFMQSYELLAALMQLSGGGGFGGGGADMLINLFVARRLMEDLGIRVSDEEARLALEQIPALQTNGKFDISRGQQLEEMAASMGFEREDLLGIMKDTVGLRKLQELVTEPYVASTQAANKLYASNYHTFKGSKITFETESFKKAAKVTDEEIKKYYEENKETYKTPEKRSIQYVLFENPKDLDKKPLEERQKAQNDQVKRVNDFNDLTMKEKKSFKEAAEKTKEKVVTTPLFSVGEPPEALKSESSLIEMIFARAADSKTPPEAIEGVAGWYVFDLVKVEESKPQTLAEVTEKIKDVLLTQKADEERTKAVNDARTALNEGLKAGKKIADLAKENKLTLEALPDIDIANPPQEVPNAFLIAQQAAKTAVGGVSNAVDYDKGTLLIYVEAKELRKRPDADTVRASQVDNLSRQESQRLFNAWFAKKKEEAKVQMKIGAA